MCRFVWHPFTQKSPWTYVCCDTHVTHCPFLDTCLGMKHRPSCICGILYSKLIGIDAINIFSKHRII